MITDARIISVEKLDRAKTVLVDAGSLSTLANVLTEPSVPTFDLLMLTERGGPTLANIIQNIVLYDTIIVDSLLFEETVGSDISTASELFPNVIRGIYLRWGVRKKIGKTVQEIALLDNGPPSGISQEEWIKWQWQESSEIPLMDKMRDVVPTLLPPDYENDPEERRLSEEMGPQFHAGIPLCCFASMMTLGRAHFYLELARELGVPLSADPCRSRYFEILLSNFKDALKKGVPEKTVAFFEGKVLIAPVDESEGLISVDLSVPAVAELVVNYAKLKKCSLRTATMEVRESKNAVKFREWCRRFASLEGQGRAAAKEQTEMVAELKQVCETWRNDVREEVEYKTRKLNLEKIPYIGQVLKALNMHELVTIRDPVLIPKRQYSYFLFLNDLLRPPNKFVL